MDGNFIQNRDKGGGGGLLDRRKVIIGGVVLLLIVAASFFLLNGKKNDNSDITGDSEEAVNQLLERVGRHIQLPLDERPIVATIEDVESLRIDQDFYKDANNGDRLLVFKDKAIIYSLEKDIIINLGPVIFESGQTTKEEEPSPTPTPEPEPTEPVTVEVRNATTISGLAGFLSERLKEENSLFDVVKVGNASKQYDETVLVDLSDGEAGSLIAELEEILGSEAVEEIPEGERETGAKILILIGEPVQ